jgi:hypothetical protein
MYMIYFMFGVLFNYLLVLVVEPIRNKWRRDCKFDCSKCKVWDCDKKVCDYKKQKYFSKKDGVNYEK